MSAATTNGPSTGSAVATTNANKFSTLDFDTSTQEIAWFSVAMPKQWNEGTVTFQPVFSQLTTAAGGVTFDLSAAACSDGDSIDVAMGAAQTSAKTAGTLNTLYFGAESSAITIAGSPAAGDWVQYRVRRVPADASDTLAQDARLHGVILYITTDSRK
jgi:hypothetical protein